MKHPIAAFFQTHLLHTLRARLEAIEVTDVEMARRICQLIPARCPFERRIQVFGYTCLYIPPLCKLNPFYEQLVALRFKALTHLAEATPEIASIEFI